MSFNSYIFQNKQQSSSKDQIYRQNYRLQNLIEPEVYGSTLSSIDKFSIKNRLRKLSQGNLSNRNSPARNLRSGSLTTERNRQVSSSTATHKPGLKLMTKICKSPVNISKHSKKSKSIRYSALRPITDTNYTQKIKIQSVTVSRVRAGSLNSSYKKINVPLLDLNLNNKYIQFSQLTTKTNVQVKPDYSNLNSSSRFNNTSSTTNRGKNTDTSRIVSSPSFNKYNTIVNAKNQVSFCFNLHSIFLHKEKIFKILFFKKIKNLKESFDVQLTFASEFRQYSLKRSLFRILYSTFNEA